MKSAYLAVCYICNERCCFCPCSQTEKRSGMITNIDELKYSVNRMAEENVTDITISGGEPTLHPNLCELVKYIQNKEIKVTILSNSERFSELKFLDCFLKSVDVGKIKVITTLHSNIASEHEKANQTKGSFERTIKGLSYLSQNRVRIIIKHCITKENYTNLRDFYIFCDEMFDKKVDIQLCSIDYCGIPQNQMKKEMLTFMDLRPYLEETFECHISRKKEGRDRQLYCINVPLCSCDVVYWSYLRGTKNMYDTYKDPHKKEIFRINDNSGISKVYCKDCKAAFLCSGTYFTAFEAFEDRIIKPFL